MSPTRGAMPQPPEPPVAGPPLTYHLIELAVQKGSPVTSRDQMPRPLVSALQCFGLRVLVGIPEALALGTPGYLLLVVLHLCLAKKLLAWLVRNNRPVMLEPYHRRLETGVAQDPRVTRRELRRVVPPEQLPTGGSFPANSWPWRAASCWRVVQSSTGLSGQTIGMRQTPCAGRTAKGQGRGATAPPRSRCRPGFRTSTMN